MIDQKSKRMQYIYISLQHSTVNFVENRDWSEQKKNAIYIANDASRGNEILFIYLMANILQCNISVHVFLPHFFPINIKFTFSILFSPQLFFRSTTMTLMLSELFRPKARRVSSAAASTLRDGYNAPAPSSSIRGPELRSIAASGAGVTSRRHSRATSQANSLERTSHKPSLARIKHSSSGSLFVNVISGSDVTNGLRYLSPVERKKWEFKTP